MNDEARAIRLFDLSGHTVVVTGAAGGIGRQMAQVAACNGAHVILIDVDASRVAASTAELAASGFSASAVALDVTDTDALERALDDTTARYGRLDAVFANAGISAGPGFAGQSNGAGGIRQIDTGLWNQVIATNLTSVMHTIRIAAGHMVPRRYGRIVVTASIAGLRAEPFVNYPYAVAKAGVVNLVRQAAVELAPSGVTVNAIAPGFIGTDIGGGRLHSQLVRDRLSSGIPMARIGDANELCGLALYLASPACSYTTGAIIAVDGGLTAR